MPVFRSTPEDAWRDYIADAARRPAWIEDSAPISDEIGLSKRELFGLILLCHLRRNQFDNYGWFVGYDPDGIEPNDGFVSNGETTTHVEHKVIPQMAMQSALEAILSTYEKYARRGECQRECKNPPLGETKNPPLEKKGGRDDQPGCMLPSDDCVGRKRNGQA